MPEEIQPISDEIFWYLKSTYGLVLPPELTLFFRLSWRYYDINAPCWFSLLMEVKEMEVKEKLCWALLYAMKTQDLLQMPSVEGQLTLDPITITLPCHPLVGIFPEETILRAKQAFSLLGILHHCVCPWDRWKL